MHDLRVTYNVLILGNHMPQNSSKFDFTCHYVLTDIAFCGTCFTYGNIGIPRIMDASWASVPSPPPSRLLGWKSHDTLIQVARQYSFMIGFARSEVESKTIDMYTFLNKSVYKVYMFRISPLTHQHVDYPQILNF